jgi:hypothetical protein
MERMDRDYRREHRHNRPVFDQRRQMNSRRGWGVVLILVGLVALGNVFDIIPYEWKDIIISWQMLVIAIGVISIFNNRNIGWGLILILFGGLSLANRFIDFGEWRHAFWPMVLLVFGLYLIIAPPRYLRQWTRPDQGGDDRDFIDEVAVFSGGDRIITSQNFKGGRILSVFGGSKINLMNAKLAEGRQVLDTMSIFGGSNIIVPAGWTVKVEVVAIFGGFSDKRERMPNLVYDQNTMLVIKGMAIFGGGEVKSYGV